MNILNHFYVFLKARGRNEALQSIKLSSTYPAQYPGKRNQVNVARLEEKNANELWTPKITVASKGASEIAAGRSRSLRHKRSK